LDEYIKPTESIFGKYVVESDVAKTEDALEYELTRA
jgi:hypothetical protein